MKKIVIISKFNCQSFPLTDKAIEVDENVLKEIGKTKCFDVENNTIIDYDNSQDLIDEKKNELRAKREPLLRAFDIYKSNVYYGIVEESESERVAITNWYKSLLDVESTTACECAINNVPEKVGAYL